MDRGDITRGQEGLELREGPYMCRTAQVANEGHNEGLQILGKNCKRVSLIHPQHELLNRARFEEERGGEDFNHRCLKGSLLEVHRKEL